MRGRKTNILITYFDTLATLQLNTHFSNLPAHTHTHIVTTTTKRNMQAAHVAVTSNMFPSSTQSVWTLFLSASICLLKRVVGRQGERRVKRPCIVASTASTAPHHRSDWRCAPLRCEAGERMREQGVKAEGVSLLSHSLSLFLAYRCGCQRLEFSTTFTPATDTNYTLIQQSYKAGMVYL